MMVGVTKEDSKMKSMPCSSKQTNEIYRFVSKMMDILCMAGTVWQTEQPNYLAEQLGFTVLYCAAVALHSAWTGATCLLTVFSQGSL
eukprot:1144467-Pelagomonas_calceolata.AAC.2